MNRAGFVENLLHLIDLDRTVPDFSPLSRRQMSLKAIFRIADQQARRTY